MRLLGIETSCDETSVAVIDEQGRVLANVIASQIERHRPFGGVVPEIASREHLEHLMPLVEKALADAGIARDGIDAVAVTVGPGLIGALLVGVAAAQGLAWGLGIPMIPVNHLEGHIVSPWLQRDGEARSLPSRFLSLVVSGGHSSIYEVEAGDPPRVRMINRTRDDAAGEVFDKVAKFLGLPYPGGPHVERVARTGDQSRFPFPVARFKDDTLDFSFSGLKSNAIRLARQEGLAGRGEDAGQKLADFCASFQRAIGDQILDRLDKLYSQLRSEGHVPAELGLAGGVAANTMLRERVAAWCAERGIIARLPEKRFCTDNAAMIAFAGLYLHGARGAEDPRRQRAASRMAVGADASRVLESGV
ncbi:MAG TPA: tRNA (adenosine(37)-N6)-threonylcarbamoyltransferase complex transferase subunit TsaD [Thermoanaerobaculia bacterium]|nr:tRNA (adenosine(37)-N6)-threonylcarbamoyltransferase complex transferase subunit TsaD [Thermoanaerobaculia bacterium]